MAFSPTVGGNYLAGPGVFVPTDDNEGQIIDPRTGKPFPKKGQYDSFPLPNVITQASLISSAWRTYMHQWDESIKKCREDALAMRRDSFFRGLLQERKLASTGLKWEIEVDNEKDPTEKALKDGLTAIINRISRFQQLRYYLAEKIWYGRYGAQLRLGWQELNLPAPSGKSGGGAAGFKSNKGQTRRALCVIPGYPHTDDPGHIPVNGDKIGHNWDHVPYLMVNSAYDTQLPDEPAPQPIWSTFAKAQPLKGHLREQFIIDKHEVDDADFFHAEMAEGIHGVGVRSVMYFLWWLRDEWLSNISDIIERTAWGIRLWYFQGGNQASETAVQQAAERNIGRFNILVPRFPGERGGAVEGMEVIDLPTQGLEFVKGMIDWIDQAQERFLVGQSMSGGADHESGLGGSGRARFAANTKYQIVKFDCANTDDTFTTDLIGPIKKYTYPDLDEMPARFRTKVDDPDAKNWIAGVKSIVEMGGAVPASPVYDRAGIPLPEEGDVTLSTKQQLEEKFEVEAKTKVVDAKIEEEQKEADQKRQLEMEDRRFDHQAKMQDGQQAHQKEIQESTLEAKRQEYPPGSKKKEMSGKPEAQQVKEKARTSLSKEDFDEIKHLYNSGLTQDEIAKRKGVSRQRVGQILHMERPQKGTDIWQAILEIVPAELPAELPALLGVVDDIKVMAVDGDVVNLMEAEDKDHPPIDFTMGANGQEASWIPKDEVWIDNRFALKDWPFVILHELIERQHMEAGLTYSQAHDIANKHELEKRKEAAGERVLLRNVRSQVPLSGANDQLHSETVQESFAWEKENQEALAFEAAQALAEQERDRQESLAAFERPSYLTVLQLVEKLKRIDSSHGKYRELAEKLRELLDAYPDLRRHIPAEDYLWLRSAT